MEGGAAAEVEKAAVSDDASQLHRNRSFKSKLLVRSQAIREAQSPPRTVSPSLRAEHEQRTPAPPNGDALEEPIGRKEGADWRSDDIRKSASEGNVSSQASSEGKDGGDAPIQRVEIQITSGAWGGDCERGACAESAARLRSRRWLARPDAQPELLSNNPRVTCVCGACRGYEARRARLCVDCRGRRRYGGACPAKQDSGIGCSQDCPDCVDSPEILVSPAKDPMELRRHRPRHKSESHDDADNICRCQEKKERIPKIASLTRTDSEEKKELTPEQLVRFIRDTLNKSMRDRLALLRIERELISLVNDVGRCVVRFPSVTSYGRMLIHRCAELFQLKHTLDHSNKNTILVSKTGTSGGTIPCTDFQQWCTAVLSPSPQRQDDGTQAKSILKRSAHSLDEALAGGAAAGGAAARSKSFEQREEEYERVRRRIFSSADGQTEESQWPWLPAGPVKLLTPDSAVGKHSRLLKVQSLEVQGGGGGGGGGAGAAAGPRGAVSKSHSFGGYGREEQQPRILSRQGDLASSSWRLSPSSSGYKTLSLRSTDSVTPSPTGGVSPEPGGPPLPDGGTLVWAVTDLSVVPPGALIIHPQTGRPLTNSDGSVYHYDPARPPLLGNSVAGQSAHVPAADDDTTEQNQEKRRGRLQKQNSFIDRDCECQTEGYPSENCCSCCEAKSQMDWSYQCYHTNQEVVSQAIPKSQEYYPQNQQTTDDAPSSAADNLQIQQNPETTIPQPPECCQYESTNQERAPSNHVQDATNQIQNCRPTSQSVEMGNRTTGLDYQAAGQVKDLKGGSKRAEDESYQYPTDYGPSVNGDMAHYAMPYYQAGNQNFRVNEEVQVQPQAVTSPLFTHEQQMQHAAVSKPAAVNYDTALRQQQLSLGGMVYSAAANQTGYPYTNHCRMEPTLHPQQQLYSIVTPHDVKSPPPQMAPTFAIEPGYFPAQGVVAPEGLLGASGGLQGYTLGGGYAHHVGCAGACGLDPTTGVFHCLTPAQRSLGLTYAQHLEQQQQQQQQLLLQSAGYQLPGMLLQQQAATPTPAHPYQYAAPNQWPTAWQQTLIATPSAIPPNCAASAQKPATPPNLYIPQQEIPLTYHPSYPKPELVNFPSVYPVMQYSNYGYPQYNALIPQMLPHSYPVVHPLYPVAIDRQSEQILARRNSGVRSYESMQKLKYDFSAKLKNNSVTNSSRTTPLNRYTPPVAVECADAAKSVGLTYPSVPYEPKPEPKESPSRRHLAKQSSLDGGCDRRRAPRGGGGGGRQDSASSAELASKIQQIKEQMSHLNVQRADHRDRPVETGGYVRGGDGRARSFVAPDSEAPHNAHRHNSGNGLLGNYPAGSHQFGGRAACGAGGGAGTAPQDGSQLSSAARAIVNSIRSLQSRQHTAGHANFHHENSRRRYDYQTNFTQRGPPNYPADRTYNKPADRTCDFRPDYRHHPRPDGRRPQTYDKGETAYRHIEAETGQDVAERVEVVTECQNLQERVQEKECSQDTAQSLAERNPNVTGRNSNIQNRNPNIQDRNPNAQDRSPNIEDRNPDLQERNPNIQDRNQNLERNPNVMERNPNLSDRNLSLPERNPNVQDLNLNLSEVNPNLSARNPNMQDRKPNLSERSPPIQDINPNIPERNTNAHDRNPLMQDRNPHIQDRNPHIQDRNPPMQDRHPNLSEMPPQLERVQSLPEVGPGVPDSIQNIRREEQNRRREQRTEGRSQDMRTDGQMARGRNVQQVMPYQYGRPYVFRQMSAGSWCRRSPGPPAPAGFNPRYGPRRPAPDTRRR